MALAYLSGNIANILEAVALATQGAARQGNVSPEYLDGVRYALIAVGLAVGLQPEPEQVTRGDMKPLSAMRWIEATKLQQEGR